jgi:NodT family efflux transporter outer membrane factor (OMF) lipoprotein
MNRAPALLILGTGFALASCATRIPQVLTPQLLPAAFVTRPDAAPVWPHADWWRGFESPELTELILAARDGNADLAAAAARVSEAQARMLIARSAQLPQLALSAQAVRSGSETPAGTTTAPGASPAMGKSASSSTANHFSLGMNASYELDLWGLARANLRAAQQSLRSTRFAGEALTLSISAGVADGYFTVLALRERIAIANEDITAINGILDVIRLRVTAGGSSHLDLAEEQAQVEAVEAQLPVLEEQELEARVALSVLLGRPPEGFEVKAQDASGIQLPSATPGMPSELLLRRPDVAEAEANLASAHASLDAVRAAFLPQLSLTGTGGVASTALRTLLHGPSLVWSAGASLLQTIFDGTMLGQKRLAEATQRQLIANYRSAVLNACADVESALGQVRATSVAEGHLRREVDAAREAFGIAQLQYRQGVAELLTVLQAQQTLFSARDQLAQMRLARAQAVVHLFEALGGGWSEPPQERTQLAVDPAGSQGGH